MKIVHGKNYTYTTYKCRCDACKEAHAIAGAKFREAKAAELAELMAAEKENSPASTAGEK